MWAFWRLAASSWPCRYRLCDFQGQRPRGHTSPPLPATDLQQPEATFQKAQRPTSSAATDKWEMGVASEQKKLQNDQHSLCHETKTSNPERRMPNTEKGKVAVTQDLGPSLLSVCRPVAGLGVQPAFCASTEPRCASLSISPQKS